MVKVKRFLLEDMSTRVTSGMVLCMEEEFMSGQMESSTRVILVSAQ
jgi:hypothetical protein